MAGLKFKSDKLRSATIVVAATLALGASTALADNVKKVLPTSSPHAAASAHPTIKPSSKPGGTPAPSASKSPFTTAPTAPTAPMAPPANPPQSGDSHGDCVSKVANDPKAMSPNKHGKTSHGAAVSKAAHDCPKGADDGQGDNGHGTETPDSAKRDAPA